MLTLRLCWHKKLPLLLLNLLWLSSCWAQAWGQKTPQDHLAALQIQNLPDACRFENPPGPDWLCPLTENPYFSQEAESVQCIQRRIFEPSPASTDRFNNAKATLLQAIVPKKQGREAGMFALSFENQKTAQDFAKRSRFKALLNPPELRIGSREEIFVAQGLMVYYWQDSESLCSKYLRQHIIRQLGLEQN